VREGYHILLQGGGIYDILDDFSLKPEERAKKLPGE